MKETDAHIYDDIIELPHHQSVTHPHMSNYDRAAQFAPFAALTGHDEAIRETARLTDTKVDLDDYEKAILNDKLQIIMENIGIDEEVTIIYFLPDENKSGGSYVSFSGIVKKVDEYEGKLIFTDRKEISIEQIIKIEGNIFRVTDSEP